MNKQIEEEWVGGERKIGGWVGAGEENWFILTQNRFMFFDRNEIHIQAFVNFINGK